MVPAVYHLGFEVDQVFCLWLLDVSQHGLVVLDEVLGALGGAHVAGAKILVVFLGLHWIDR